MDLNKVLRVLLKHKLLLIFGFVLSLALGWFSLYKVNFTAGKWEVKPRSLTKYETRINLFVDQPGFPLGRVGKYPEEAGNYGRTVELANVYSFLITSEKIMRKVEEKVGPINGEIQASAVPNTPIIVITVRGTDPSYISRLAEITANIFISYVKESQELNKIPPDDRIIISTLAPPAKPVPLQSRKLEIAFLTFLGTFALVCGLIFLIENLEMNRKENKLQKLSLSEEESTINSSSEAEEIGS
jgi:capsular polysaccharide biosynthesis protein